MTNLNYFLSQYNLNKMTNDELIKIWGFILSDHEQIYVIDKIKNILEERNKKK